MSVKMSSEKQIQSIQEKFNTFWPKLLSEVVADPEFENLPIAVEWLKEVMVQNVPHGKQHRGLAMISFYNKLVKTPDDSNLPYVAAWMIEIHQAAALMADDIMDGSTTRRGGLCWYKQSHVGPSAVNDCFMLENLGYFICYKYFSRKSYFPRFLNLIHDISMKTIMGQCLDTRCAFIADLKTFTQGTYEAIVKYKTSYYSFYSPVAIAMTLANITDESMYREIEEVTIKLGYLFQVQDDFLDCYGDYNITGKIGTDIEDGKCTWLLVKALEIATNEQFQVLQACYGSKNKDDEIAVREIYDDLKIKSLFYTFEKSAYAAIKKMINDLPESLPKKSLHWSLNVIYKRDH